MFLPITVLFATTLTIVNCANFQIRGKIVGGNEVRIEKYPFAVSVRDFGSHICGGSILSTTMILTAAHCTNGRLAYSMSIRTGATKADNGIFHQVKTIHQHPKFNDDNNRYDVSLLELVTPIVYTNSSQPAKLAERRLPDSSSVEISGWGVHSYKGNTKNLGLMNLRAVKLQIVNQQICEENYAEDTKITNLFICAAAKGRDSCQGDSGGGLIRSGTREIVGVSSFGEGCAKLGKPGVYASTTNPNLSDYIKKFIGI